jgi:pyruvate,orthophosphate dikinase
VGCEQLDIDYASKTATANGRKIRQGDWMTLDGNQGAVYEGEVKLSIPELPQAFSTLMGWADGIRRLGIRTNADTPHDAKKAREMGAEGIGLCRTEHMFFKDFEQPEKSADRQLAIQEMIVADSSEARRKALAKLLPYQRRDFAGIFREMDGYPVTIRLVDPPLHEFVPHDREKQEELARKIGVDVEVIVRRVEQLHEANPMLGHRGCRLAITYPEFLEMQVQAIIEAAVECKKSGIKVLPEIMHPLVMDRKEFQILADATHRVAGEIIRKSEVKLEYTVGTMIEVPRAVLLAGEIAELAEFFSFGTNDLTQMSMGLSRDDAGRFLPDYVDEKKAGIFPDDPFQSIDIPGVGLLMRWCIERGRAVRPKLKIGICGEHGGDAGSVKFCHQAGLDYVSASPFRVPIARLAAAQAVIEDRAARKRGKKR